MIYALVFYWLVCGIRCYLETPLCQLYDREVMMAVLCLIFGGILVPARLIAKVIK